MLSLTKICYIRTGSLIHEDEQKIIRKTEFFGSIEIRNIFGAHALYENSTDSACMGAKVNIPLEMTAER